MAGEAQPSSSTMKQVLVGGPLLGRHQCHAASGFAAWEQFEPLITPQIPLEKRPAQRFVLLPHSRHITVLAYETGAQIASLVPCMEEEDNGDNQTLIESVCLTKYRRKVGETTAQDVLDKMALDDDDDDNLDHIGNGGIDQFIDEVVVLAACRDGTIREFLLKDLEKSIPSTSISCGSYYVSGPCHRPRRVVRVTKKEPIMMITAPPLRVFNQQDGIVTYVAVQTKGLGSEGTGDARTEKTDSINVAVLRALIPYFDGSPDVTLLRKDKEETQWKWQLDKFKCRIGKNKNGTYFDTSPFRLLSVAKPLANDYAIFIVLARANAVQVYYDRAKLHHRYAPITFTIPQDNPISALTVSGNASDITCGHQLGEISVMNDILTQVENYHLAMAKFGGNENAKTGKPEDPRSNVKISKVHWHAHPVASLVCDPTSPPMDPILFSGGEEAVLVTWQISKGRSKPAHVLPRVALGNIVHVKATELADDSPSNGILVFCDDNSLQLFESHNKGRLWKVQGIAFKERGAQGLRANSRIERDPRTTELRDAQIVMTGLREAPGYIHWYDPIKRRMAASLEVAPFNRVSKAEAQDDAMPIPSVTSHEFLADGQELITIEESPTENLFVGAYDKQHQNGSFGLVTTIKFWVWNDNISTTKGSKVPYNVSASMTYPHGPKNRVAALAATKDGLMACTVSNDERAFRLWQKVIPDEGDETRRMPAWTCQCKVTVPAGFSNFMTGRNGVAFSDDGSIIAISFGNMVTLWDSHEARFLRSIRHLEGALGTIDMVRFVNSGRLKDVMLIKSEYGVSLLSPFGSRGSFKGWSWGIPLGVKDTRVSDAALIGTHNCVAISHFNAVTGRSRIVLIDSTTGQPANIAGSGSMLENIEGRVISIFAADKPQVKSNWGEKSTEKLPCLRLFGLMSTGNLLLFTNDKDDSAAEAINWQPIAHNTGPTLAIALPDGQKRKRQSDDYSLAHSEPAKKLNALGVFGLAATADSSDKATIPSTSELPSLSKQFVRAFVGRGLLRVRPSDT